jgi:hypothetical protein
MTTAERYRSPTETEVTTVIDVTALLAVFGEFRQASLPIVQVTAGKTEAPILTPRARAELLARLAELSVDPNSMDRHSEIDIWGFHNGS